MVVSIFLRKRGCQGTTTKTQPRDQDELDGLTTRSTVTKIGFWLTNHPHGDSGQIIRTTLFDQDQSITVYIWGATENKKILFFQARICDHLPRWVIFSNGLLRKMWYNKGKFSFTCQYVFHGFALFNIQCHLGLLEVLACWVTLPWMKLSMDVDKYLDSWYQITDGVRHQCVSKLSLATIKFFFSLVRSSAGFLRVMVSPKFSSKLVFSREINVCEVLQVLGNVFSPHNAAPKKTKLSNYLSK